MLYLLMCLVAMTTGARDETIRVWNILHGNLLTMFHLHQIVLDLAVTSDASRIVVRFQSGRHLPVLCLHNSPVGDASVVKSRSQVQLSMVGGYFSLITVITALVIRCEPVLELTQ